LCLYPELCCFRTAGCKQHTKTNAQESAVVHKTVQACAGTLLLAQGRA
jgi:hypothetical protein